MNSADYKEAFLSVYDEYIDREEFPMDVSKIYVLMNPHNMAISAGYQNDYPEIENRMNTSGRFSFFFDRRYREYSFTRDTPVFADGLVGELKVKMSVGLKSSNYHEAILTREKFKELISDMFEKDFAIKTGVSGEIIRSMCIKMINISRVKSELISLEKFEEDMAELDFIIKAENKDESMTLRHLIFHLNNKKEYVRTILSPIDLGKLSPEFLENYIQANENLLLKMHEQSKTESEWQRLNYGNILKS